MMRRDGDLGQGQMSHRACGKLGESGVIENEFAIVPEVRGQRSAGVRVRGQDSRFKGRRQAVGCYYAAFI
jgi:hypothetical protein